MSNNEYDGCLHKKGKRTNSKLELPNLTGIDLQYQYGLGRLI